MSSGLRLGAAIGATTLIKGLFGMAPGYLSALIPTMGPSMAVPLLIGAGLLEGAISLSVFSLIMKKENRRYLIRAFLLASVVSVASTFFLSGILSPIALTLVSNLLRLGLFSLLTRPPEKELGEHLVDEVKTVVGKEPEDTVETSMGVEFSAKELDELRRESYQKYIDAETIELRAKAYKDFNNYTNLLSELRKKNTPQEETQ